MDNFNLKKFLVENKLTYQETMKEKAKKLKEEKIPFFHTQQILKLQDLSKTLPQQEEAELRVGLNVLPKQAYRNERDIRSAIGKVTKIVGDKVFVKRNDGKEEEREKSDLVHIVDFTNEIVKKDKHNKIDELSMHPDEDLKKMIKLMGYDDLEAYFYDTTNGAAKAQLDFIMSKPTTKNLLHMKGIDPNEW